MSSITYCLKILSFYLSVYYIYNVLSEKKKSNWPITDFHSFPDSRKKARDEIFHMGYQEGYGGECSSFNT